MADGNSHYGNGGLSGGLGAGPAAIAFLDLTKLQTKYQELVQAKADLSTDAGKCAQANVTEQNTHYSNEMWDQTLNDWSNAVMSLATAAINASLLLATGIGVFKGVKTSRGNLAEAEENLNTMTKLRESFEQDTPVPQRVMGRDGAPPTPQRIEECAQKLCNEKLSDVSANYSEDEQVAAIRKLREESRCTPEARAEQDRLAEEDGTRKPCTEKEREAIEAKIETRVAQASQSVNTMATKVQSVLMRAQFANEFFKALTQAGASAYQGYIKSISGWGGESQNAAHNQQQLNILYSQYAQAVMNDQMNQLGKAIDQMNAVMTQLLKTINESARV